MLHRDRLKILQPKASGPQTHTGRIPQAAPVVIWDGPSLNRFGAPEIVRLDGKAELVCDVRSFLPSSLAARDAIDTIRTGMPAIITRGSDGKTFDAQVVDARQGDRRVRLQLVSQK